MHTLIITSAIMLQMVLKGLLAMGLGEEVSKWSGGAASVDNGTLPLVLQEGMRLPAL